MLGSSRLCFVGLLVVALAGAAEATNGLKLTAYGPRSAGRGGVDYAYADDAIGPATNPAGMAFVYGNRFDQNWAVVIPKVSWTNQAGETFRNKAGVFIPLPAFSFGTFVDPSKDWEIAPIFDLGSWGLEDEGPEEATPDAKVKGPPADADEESDLAELTDAELYGGRLRIGFGVFPLTGAKIKIANMRTAENDGNPIISRPVNYETNVLSLIFAPSVAYRFNKHFSAGITFQVRYTQFELDGVIAQPLSTLSPAFRTVTSIFSEEGQILTVADIDDGSTNTENNNGQWGVSFRIGVQFRSRYFSAGLIYQDRTYSTDIFGRASVDATDQIMAILANSGLPLSAISALGVNPALGFASEYDVRIQDFEFPRMFGLGFAFNPHERFSIGFDYTFILWEEVMRVFKSRLSNGSNPNLDVITSPTLNVRIPLGFRNQHVIAVGLSALALRGDDIVEGVPSYELVLRAGWNYAKNPTPGKTTLPQQPTIGEHHATTGFTFHWGPLVELSFAFDYTLPTSLSTGQHEGNFTLSNSKQRMSIMFFHFGLGVNF